MAARRQHISTLMQRHNIRSLAPQPGTSKSCPRHTIYPYLLRHVAVSRSNQVWALDTTYIPMEKGFFHLTAVIDVASRRVLAHKTATTLEACHAVKRQSPRVRAVPRLVPAIEFPTTTLAFPVSSPLEWTSVCVFY